jgi:hypothetical protein
MSHVILSPVHSVLDALHAPTDAFDASQCCPDVTPQALRRKSQQGELVSVLQVMSQISERGMRAVGIHLEHMSTIEELRRRGFLVDPSDDGYHVVSWYPDLDMRQLRG